MVIYKLTAGRRRSVECRSSSELVTETVYGSHTFKIKGYSLTKGMGVGKYIASKKFSIGGYEWVIHFYPDGKNSTDASYVSLFIRLISEGTDVGAFFELDLLDHRGKRKHHVGSHVDHSLQDGPYTFNRCGSMWGYNRFYKRKDLDESTLLKDDCLKINCTVGVLVTSYFDSSNLNTIQVPESEMGEHFGMLLDTEAFSDVTFLVGGERFYAHKIVLAARSKVFLTEFVNGVEKDEHGNIVLKDIELSRDTLIQDEELNISRSSLLPSLSETFPAKLLAAAEKYDLSRLKLICASQLCKDISLDSVAYILVLADRYQVSDLKFMCLKFSAQNLNGVMQSDGFKYLSQNYPLLQAELLKTVADCQEPFSGKRKYKIVKTQSSDVDGDHIEDRKT